MYISRRELIKSLSVAAASASALGIVPLEAAEQAHRMVSAEKAGSRSGDYTPKFFSAKQYETLRALCQTIIPSDDETGGALEAGAPEFVDLLTSENNEFQLQLGGGILWLDSTCTDRYGHSYLNCGPAEQKEILDRIAFRKNADQDRRLGPGIEFFSALRKLTVDGFFTSKIGIKYLGYIGNTYLKEFPGCPEIPSGVAMIEGSGSAPESR
jgi:gluconate 2-dehydrogenase gamma chain